MPGRSVLAHIDTLVRRYNAATPAQRARMLGLAR